MRIFLFRGLLGDVFSTGINQLAGKLRQVGHVVSTHRWGERKSIQKKYLREFASNDADIELAIIGHSLGANSAIIMANKFADAGLPVRYLATLDAIVRRRVHSSIAAADNFRSKDFRTKPIDGAVEFARNDLNHIQIDKDLEIHTRIVNGCRASGNGNSDNELEAVDVEKSGMNGDAVKNHPGNLTSILFTFVNLGVIGKLLKLVALLKK